MLKHSVDICKISQGFAGNFITKALMEHFNSSADFSIKCPFKKRAYSLTNYKISDMNSGWMSDNFIFLVTGKTFGKVKNMKTPISVGTVNVYGSHKKTQ